MTTAVEKARLRSERALCFASITVPWQHYLRVLTMQRPDISAIKLGLQKSYCCPLSPLKLNLLLNTGINRVIFLFLITFTYVLYLCRPEEAVRDNGNFFFQKNPV